MMMGVPSHQPIPRACREPTTTREASREASTSTIGQSQASHRISNSTGTANRGDASKQSNRDDRGMSTGTAAVVFQ